MPLQYEYLPKQYEFLKACESTRHPAYIGGFGSGKSHVLNLEALVQSSKRSFGLVGASTYRLLADTTQRKFFQLCPEAWMLGGTAEKGFLKSENKVFLKNGTEIIFRALDTPEKLTNLEVDWFLLDEVGEVKLETFRMLQGRLRKPGGSHLGAVVGNPAGPSHWSYEYFVLKAAEFPETYKLIQATSYENTFLDPEYAEEMAKSYGKDSLYYKRFVLGEFVSFEGAYWPHFNIRQYPDGHILTDEQLSRIFRREPIKNAQGKDYWLLDLQKPWTTGKVIDFGFEHPFVCLWYITDRNRIIYFDEYFLRHGLIQDHCQVIRTHERAHLEKWNVTTPQIAYTDHDAVSRNEIQNCKDKDGNFIGFSCIPAEKLVMEGILLVQTLINTNSVYISATCKNAIIEIPSYRAKPLLKSADEKPIKEKDDTCDCIRMSCWELLKHKSIHMRMQQTQYKFVDTTQPVGDFMDNLHKTAFS